MIQRDAPFRFLYRRETTRRAPAAAAGAGFLPVEILPIARSVHCRMV